MPKFPRPNLALTTTMLLWGFNMVAIKLALTQMTPAALVLVRGSAMYVCLLAICRMRGLSLRFPRRDIPWMLLQGFSAMGVYMVLFTVGMKTSSPAEGAIILVTAPAMAACIATAVGQEAFRMRRIVGMGVAFLGVVLVELPSIRSAESGAKLFGNALLLAGAVLWAVNAVFTRSVLRKHEPLSMLTFSMPGGLLALVPFGLHDALHTPYGSFTFTTWWSFAYVTLASGAIGFTLFYLGIKQAGASGALTYQYLVPPLATIFGWLVLGSGLQWIQLAGLIVVLGGVAVSTGSPRTRPTEVDSNVIEEAADAEASLAG